MSTVALRLGRQGDRHRHLVFPLLARGGGIVAFRDGRSLSARSSPPRLGIVVVGDGDRYTARGKPAILCIGADNGMCYDRRRFVRGVIVIVALDVYVLRAPGPWSEGYCARVHCEVCICWKVDCDRNIGRGLRVQFDGVFLPPTLPDAQGTWRDGHTRGVVVLDNHLVRHHLNVGVAGGTTNFHSLVFCVNLVVETPEC